MSRTIANRGLTMLGNYVNVDSKALFSCNKGHTWETTPYHITRKGNPTGCPFCANQAPLTTAIVNARIKDRGYILLDEFKTNTFKVRFQCKEGHVWKAKPNNVLNGRGCPECAEYGKSDNDIFYLWVAIHQKRIQLKPGELLVKFGITSERLENKRIREVANDWKAKSKILAMIKTSIPATSIEEAVSSLGRKLPSNFSRFDGWTEFRIVSNDEIIQLMSIASDLADYKIVWNENTEEYEQLGFDIE